MKKLYTAVGRITFKRQKKGMRCPQVILGEREYILDMQEMLLWSILNWRILSIDEIETLYKNKEKETGIASHRSAEDCLGRLVQRGLVNCGQGETDVDALYDLLSGLCAIPISESLILRAISFVRMTVFRKIPITTAKRLFLKDKRNADEKKVMHIIKQATLSTPEIIKCVRQNTIDFVSDEQLMDLLYHDEYTTCENIAYSVRDLPESRTVISSVANLYLRRQIIFERI